MTSLTGQKEREAIRRRGLSGRSQSLWLFWSARRKRKSQRKEKAATGACSIMLFPRQFGNMMLWYPLIIVLITLPRRTKERSRKRLEPRQFPDVSGQLCISNGPQCEYPISVVPFTCASLGRDPSQSEDSRPGNWSGSPLTLQFHNQVERSAKEERALWLHQKQNEEFLNYPPVNRSNLMYIMHFNLHKLMTFSYRKAMGPSSAPRKDRHRDRDRANREDRDRSRSRDAPSRAKDVKAEHSLLERIVSWCLRLFWYLLDLVGFVWVFDWGSFASQICLSGQLAICLSAWRPIF